jgi:hypothetical protein
MHISMKKRGFFFTIDVFIAMIVIVVGFILIWTSMTSRALVIQPYFLSKDTVDFLSESTILDITSRPYIQALVLSKNITIPDYENTIAEQIALFYYQNVTSSDGIAVDPPTHPQIRNNDAVLKNFTRELLNNSIPPQYSFEVILHDPSIAGKNTSLYLQQNEFNKIPENSDSLVSSKTIVSVIIKNETVRISPPYVLEVRVWQ